MRHRITFLLLLTLAVFLVLSSVFVFLWPTLKTARYWQKNGKTIDEYTRTVEQVRKAEEESRENGECGEETEVPFAGLREACERYNAELYSSGQKDLTEQTQLAAPFDLSGYGWEEDVFAVLSIPDAGIETAVYLGADSDNLVRGAAVLGQTSLPLGGENTNCVIAGHRTWNGVIFFHPLRELGEGDAVYIINPWERLAYKVTEVRIIAPTDIDAVRIQEGKDLLTLFTCTYPNTHRVLVICERSEAG
ncbi:MAG: class C sortase [Oscillospiraceae bacterium]|nr:class C sortase [Oscillospiraceae bacterium]